MDNDNGVKVEDMFTECDSPSLIEIYSSCDLKVRFFYYLIGGKTGHLYSEIMQVFDFMHMSSAIPGGGTQYTEIALLLYPRGRGKFISLSQNLILRQGN